MNHFQNKYRIPSARLQTWDYGASAAYFITICTAHREHYFGEIVETQCFASPLGDVASRFENVVSLNKMQLNEIGRIVETEWLNTIDIRADMNLEFGEFVVMPNHFHAIVIIGENRYNTNHDVQHGDAKVYNDGDVIQYNYGGARANNDGDARQYIKRDAKQYIKRDARHRVSTGMHPMNEFGPQSKNLASIIRGFKSSVTMNARKIHIDFAWQSRFYDHVIRNSEEFERIQNYIATNPEKWKGDKFNNTGV